MAQSQPVLSEILTTLRSEKDVIEHRFKTQMIGVFGSFVRGEAKRGSDIDILVKPLKGASLFELIGVELYLRKKLKRKMDIVSESSLKERIKPYIYADLVRL